VAELSSDPTAAVQPVMVGSFSIMSVVTVLIAFAFRRRLLPSAVEALQRGDANGVRRWRTANILSMVLAETIGMFGLVLRIIGRQPASRVAILHRGDNLIVGLDSSSGCENCRSRYTASTSDKLSFSAMP